MAEFIPEIKSTINLEQDRPFVVYFVRHGQAESGGPPEPMGPALSKMGQQQAANVGVRLSKENFSHAYTSDLLRAYETAQAILKFHKSTPCTVTSDLREITHFHFVRGSKVVKQALRVSIRHEKEAARKFVAMLRKSHKAGQRVLVVCHGNIIRTLIPLLANRSPKDAVLMDVGNTSVSVVDVWPNNEAVLRLGNCMRHLTTEQAST